MTLETKKRKYQKPAMQVFELKQNPKILVGSGDGGLDPLSPFNPNPGGDPLQNP